MACKKLMCHYPCPSSILKLNNSMFHITWCKIAMNEVSKVYHLKLLHIATKLVFNATFFINISNVILIDNGISSIGKIMPE
jgi:hypothetical protein